MTTMRAMTMSGAGGPEVLTLSEIERPVRVSAELLVQGRRGRRQPDRREDPRRAAARSRPSRASRRSWATTSAASWSRRRTRRIRSSPAPRSTAWRMVPRISGTYAEYLTRLGAQRHPQAVDPLARRGRRRAARRADRVGHGRRDREGPRGAADAHPRRRGRRRPLRGAVRRLLRRPRDRDRLARATRAGCASSAPPRSSTTRRRASRMASHDVDVVIDLIGNVKDDTAHPLAVGAAPGRARRQRPRAAAGRRWPRRPRRPAMRATGYQVSPDGSTLAVISRLLESGDVRVYVDQVFDLDGGRRGAPARRGGAHPRQDRAEGERGLSALEQPLADEVVLSDARRPGTSSSRRARNRSSRRSGSRARSPG